LPDLYRGALLFVYPSLYEGFGLPVVEAMACGVPVITSNRSSLPEVAGDAALLIDPTQVEALASAIATVMNDGAMRQALRIKGLARARAFSWETVAQQTLAIYRAVGGD
jgi:glycosyltransferase involved in cell wall biosynthesis